MTVRPTSTARGAAPLLIAALIGLALLPACGRRGPLEPPPGSAERARPAAGTTQETSTFMGSPSLRPEQKTETTDNTLDPDLPAVPQQPSDVIAGTQTAPSTSIVSRSSTARGPRRSPPPKVPFILDPLL